MVTIWNHRGAHRALHATIAAIITSYVLALRLARWEQPWEWVLAALLVAVLLIWFLLAKAGVRELGFPEGGSRPLSASPVGAAAALLVSAAATGAAAWLLAGSGSAAAGSATTTAADPAAAGASGMLAPGAALTELLPGASLQVLLAAVLVGAIAHELVYRGALLRLGQARWRRSTVILATAALSAFGGLPLLLTDDGTWSWLAARICGALVMGLVLSWAAVRTGGLWMPLGWQIGSGLAGVLALHLGHGQVGGDWMATAAGGVVSLLLIPTVLLLDARRARTGR